MEILFKQSSIYDILKKAEQGERLSFEDGVRLFQSNDVLHLGHIANIVRERKNGNRAYYVINRHINYSNICESRCRFCAFSRDKEDAGSYVLGREEILEKAATAVEGGTTELHIVGGLHPDLPLDFYINIIHEIHENCPGIHIKAFTAVEIDHLSRKANLPVSQTLKILKEAGLSSLPGGGAEIFSPRVREQLCPEKLSGEGWLQVMREAHKQGLRSNATMLYGHVESPEDRVNHLMKLRELQDETGGFMAFIPLAFHPKNTDLSNRSGTTAMLDLKTISISRLMLDNFGHIKAYWIMLGIKLSQVSLGFGVDDLDGTIQEEKITHAAGAETPEALSVDEIVRLIKETGRDPVERDTFYNPVKQKQRNRLLQKEVFTIND
ncbi:MAG: aminofutalosine synthase MqnE [Candidatus Loosdrechtia sp.]|uniref:aminofutalosine synthase MqnE n=1 Tax=Candidatus Loosdrechtia sp. TaxID=3101272 RepID=UPI003A78675D|nr:MAG: aminofutalosine synthase MqnE [Candidatus Jettenia sp. AMX2]